MKHEVVGALLLTLLSPLAVACGPATEPARTMPEASASATGGVDAVTASSAEAPKADLGARVRASGAGKDECARDADCQLVPTCDCGACVASKVMEVGLCAEGPCKDGSACTGLLPACRGGHCWAK